MAKFEFRFSIYINSTSVSCIHTYIYVYVVGVDRGRGKNNLMHKCHKYNILFTNFFKVLIKNNNIHITQMINKTRDKLNPPRIPQIRNTKKKTNQNIRQELEKWYENTSVLLNDIIILLIKVFKESGLCNIGSILLAKELIDQALINKYISRDIIVTENELKKIMTSSLSSLPRTLSSSSINNSQTNTPMEEVIESVETNLTSQSILDNIEDIVIKTTQELIKKQKETRNTRTHTNNNNKNYYSKRLTSAKPTPKKHYHNNSTPNKPKPKYNSKNKHHNNTSPRGSNRSSSSSKSGNSLKSSSSHRSSPSTNTIPPQKQQQQPPSSSSYYPPSSSSSTYRKSESIYCYIVNEIAKT